MSSPSSDSGRSGATTVRYGDPTSSQPSPQSLAAQPLVIDGVEFRVAPLGGFANPDHLVVVKPMDVVDAYRELLDAHDEPRMVELGIAYGGSVALLALVGRPSRFVAIELSDKPIPLLDKVVQEHGLNVGLYFGVDQADQVRIREIVDEEFGDEELDIVIDDASHMYTETVASFEVLFPRVRPGGRYIIEDWASDHGLRNLLVAGLDDPASPYHGWATQAAQGLLPSANDGQVAQTSAALASIQPDGVSGPPMLPLSRLAAQLVLGPAEPASGIASVEANDFWLVVERSDLPLDRNDYSLSVSCPDHFGVVAD